MKKRIRSQVNRQVYPRVKGPMILKEVRAAATNKVALLGGIVLGGFIPFSVYWLMHQEAPTSTSICELAGRPIVFAHLLVLGGLAYSAKTVYQWGRAVFADRFKAVGFTLLVEGILTFGHSNCLIFPALGILVLINGIAATSRLAETDARVPVQRLARQGKVVSRPAQRLPDLVQPEALLAPASLPSPELGSETLARI